MLSGRSLDLLLHYGHETRSLDQISLVALRESELLGEPFEIIADSGTEMMFVVAHDNVLNK